MHSETKQGQQIGFLALICNIIKANAIIALAPEKPAAKNQNNLCLSKRNKIVPITTEANSAIIANCISLIGKYGK